MNGLPFYEVLASAIKARLNCIQAQNDEWLERHTDTIKQLVDSFMPSGSGWDCGTKIDLDASHGEKLVFYGSFHHMNDVGYYDGWTEHTVVVTPSFSGLNLRISGRNRNEIKDHLYEKFDCALTASVIWDKETERYIYAADAE